MKYIMGYIISILQFLWRYINRIITAAHPVVCLLALISFKRNWKNFISNPAVRLFCVFAVLDLAVKCYKIFSTGIMERRYLLPIVCVLIIFAADGLLKLIPIVHKFVIKKYPSITYRKVSISIFLIVFWIFLGMILIPKNDKPWFEGMKNLVAQNCPQGVKPVVLSNNDDPQLGYYPNSDLFLLSLKNFNISDKIKLYRVPYTVLSKKLPSGIENLSQNIEKLGGENVFIFIYNVRNQDFEKMFTEKHIKFPFRLLKEYKARHNEPVCFYQFEGSK